ncbi:MAG: CPBP family intramembrane glutamic endopeptidase [Anaerolineaceae bacterium]|nr:CPBP family intramembrane glutamic endopeptidase [Anaerolineaceae bacterium]
MKNTKQLLALPFILAATAFILYFGALKPNRILQIFPTPWLPNSFIDSKFKYQAASLVVALLLLLITHFFCKENAKRFYRLGKLNASAEPIKWLGIKPSDSWKQIGINFGIVITLVTGIFIYLNIARGQFIQKENLHYLPFILLFALINAFVEEAITRLALVTSLYGSVKTPVIHFVSAALFGLPHFFGTPGGPLGVLLAGFLGWLLSKSIVETQGFFWAWFIHFLQDLVIFCGLFFLIL